MNTELNLSPNISRRAILLGAASLPVVAFGLNSIAESSTTGTNSLINGRFYRLSSKARPDWALTTEHAKYQKYTGVGIEPWTGGPDQILMVHSFNDGSISLRFPMKISGDRQALPRQHMALDINSANRAHLWDPHGEANQRFMAVPTEGGFELVCCHRTDCCLSILDASDPENSEIGMAIRTGIPTQIWTLEETGNLDVFSENTDTAMFSALQTSVDVEDHNPVIKSSNASYFKTENLKTNKYWFAGCGGTWIKYYRVSSSSSFEITYPTVGAYYGRAVGATMAVDNIKIDPDGHYEDGTPQVIISDVFSGQDPACLKIGNISQVTVTVQFFYCDDEKRTPIDIDSTYWSFESLSTTNYSWEWAKPTGGWTGEAYVLPPKSEKFGTPGAIECSFGSYIGAPGGASFTGLLADLSETYEYNSVSAEYSGSVMKVELGIARSGVVDCNQALSMRFRPLAKKEETPVHFCVYDPVAALENPSYSPKEVYQQGIQKGSTIGLDSDVVKFATIALLDAYPGAVTSEDYWWSTNEFKKRFSSVLVKSDPIYIWAKLSLGKVEYYVDGTDSGHLVFTDANVKVGNYSIPEKATTAALVGACNLDAHFGDAQSTGFTGWFCNPALTEQAGNLKVVAGRTLKLYARNRLTLRCSFTDDSIDTTTLVLRTSPESAAPLAESWTLPDFGLSDERHTLDGIALPAIGDDGPAHKALYLGETVALARPEGRVYARMEDGTWAGFRAVAWLAAQDSDTQISKVTPTRDTCVYMRVERADYDGVSSTKN